MPTRATTTKVLLLLAGSCVYLFHSPKIGLWMGGNGHNGGVLVGPVLFPLLLAAATFLLFSNRPKVNIAIAIGLVACAIGFVVLF